MAFTRGERVSFQKKQEKASIREGVPNIAELKEGVPIFRFTSEGLVQYIRANNVLYKNVLEKG